ncbi:DIP2C protein, partial [Polyodon spathula]|nr:DIP2C protein [Polyodon spathula]
MAVPMPSKRRSLVVQTSMDAYTPPGEEQIPIPECTQILTAMLMSEFHVTLYLENHLAPPDVTTYTSEHSIQVERPQGSTSRTVPKYGNAELMETGDGVPVSSRVSAKIQQLVNTLKRPKRPPLREFFVDDFEELLEVLQPDPNQPKPEGAQMLPMRGEQLGVVTNWPPSLEAALQRWGTISPKAPCLTTMDTNGKPLYILTYGKLWTRSMKVAYNILHKLGSKQEPMVRPGDRVSEIPVLLKQQEGLH